METYFISLASDGHYITECNSMRRAYYLAGKWAWSWESPVVISLVVNGELVDLDIIEPNYDYY